MKEIKKKKIIKILNIIFLCVVILLTLVEIFIVIHYVDNFINGFTPTDLFGNKTVETVYGFNAIKKDGWANLFFVPAISFISNIQIIYFLTKIKKSKKKKIFGIVFSVILFLLNILMWIFLFI